MIYVIFQHQQPILSEKDGKQLLRSKDKNESTTDCLTYRQGTPRGARPPAQFITIDINNSN